MGTQALHQVDFRFSPLVVHNCVLLCTVICRIKLNIYDRIRTKVHISRGSRQTHTETLNQSLVMFDHLSRYLAYVQHSYEDICSTNQYLLIPWTYHWTRLLHDSEFPCRCGLNDHQFPVSFFHQDGNYSLISVTGLPKY